MCIRVRVSILKTILEMVWKLWNSFQKWRRVTFAEVSSDTVHFFFTILERKLFSMIRRNQNFLESGYIVEYLFRDGMPIVCYLKHRIASTSSFLESS